MSESSRNLRNIPSVSEVLEELHAESWIDQFGRNEVVRMVKEAVSELRARLKSGSAAEPSKKELLLEIHRKLQEKSAYSLKRVINASGILVHTNLGRAPLAEEALKHLAEIARGYSNLELDLEEGTRGSREIHLERFLNELLATEAAVVVNNNAAALLLILNSLAEGKEVIVSRGELIEIGGSFRLPEIMKKSGAILREVGTTNKTKVEDYRAAINENTGMILAVHPSNFQIVGFTEKPALRSLVELGNTCSIPVVEDHGSGILINLDQFGIPEEPTVQERLAEGADLICFSGDKILGGPQAGIIAGKKDLMQRLRKNPLFRALRVDKTTYALLETTFRFYLQEKATQIPVFRMLSLTSADLEITGRSWLKQLQERFPTEEWSLQETLNYMGGDVAPMKAIPSCAIALRPSAQTADALARKLRNAAPAILTRIEEDQIFFELRTLAGDEQQEIFSILEKIL